MDTSCSRRRFLNEVGAGATTLALTEAFLAQTSPAAAGVPTRPLGSTGQRVSIVGVGGYHVGAIDESESIRLMHAAIDEGVNFFDNA